jgi:hypothetical protein
MGASELINDYIASLPDWRGTTITNIRRIIHEADPKIVEEWKWRVGYNTTKPETAKKSGGTPTNLKKKPAF